MLDGGEADDKIIAVLANDNLWGKIESIAEFPEILVERLRHYFLTYKLIPGEQSHISIGDGYDRKHAQIVIQAAAQDYDEEYGSA